jgi:hypothetical protein
VAKEVLHVDNMSLLLVQKFDELKQLHTTRTTLIKTGSQNLPSVAVDGLVQVSVRQIRKRTRRHKTYRYRDRGEDRY